MSYKDKIYLSQAQLETLASGGTVSGYSGDENTLYLVPKNPSPSLSIYKHRITLTEVDGIEEFVIDIYSFSSTPINTLALFDDAVNRDYNVLKVLNNNIPEESILCSGIDGLYYKLWRIQNEGVITEAMSLNVDEYAISVTDVVTQV